MNRPAPIRSAALSKGAAFRRRAVSALAAGWMITASTVLFGCYPSELLTLRSGLDSLRTVVDTMAVRDSITLAMIQDARREVAEQRDILLSTRATSGTTTREMFEQMGRLEAKLDEAMGRFERVTRRAPETTPVGAESNQVYDQAAQDLTQGRYDMALRGFREFVQRFPSLELADNAQYGIAECLFAQSRFDSAAFEYAKVDSLYPQSEKVPSALYKLALSLERQERSAEARAMLERLTQRFPLSGEAQLARERLQNPRRR